MHTQQFIFFSCTLTHRFLRVLTSKTPEKMRKSANNKPHHPLPKKKQRFSIFSVVLFSLQKHCDRKVFFFTLNSLSFMQYGFKFYSSCRKMLMLLFTEKAEWCLFLFLVRPREFAKSRSTKPRKATDRSILLFLLSCFDCMLLKNH